MDAEAERVVQDLELAFHRLGDSKEESYGLWRMARARASDAVRKRHWGAGYYYTEGQEETLWNRVHPKVMPLDRDSYVDFVAALMTDWTEKLAKHIQQRHDWEGNNIIQIRGPTGIGKSSVAISLADMISRIRPEELVRKHMVFDVYEVLRKMPNLVARQSVVVDEGLHMVGEGSLTISKILENAAKTNRRSGVNMIYVAPEQEDRSEAQFALECFMWSREKKRTRALVYLAGRPVGYVTLHWARKELWDAYSGWKAVNVARSLEGAFNDSAWMGRMAVEFLEREDASALLINMPKVNKTTLQDVFEFRSPVKFSSVMNGRICGLMNSALYMHQFLGPEGIEQRFGLAPGPNFSKVAAKMVEE